MMISRIVPFLFLVFWVSPSWADEPVFKQIGTSPVLVQNLSRDLAPADQDKVLAAVDQELKAPKLSRLHQDELSLAQGLVYLQKKEPKKALEAFGKILPSSILRDASLYYSIKTLRILGEEALQADRTVDAKNRCTEAQAKVADLENDPTSPFLDDLKNEKELTKNCILHAAIRLNQVAQLFPWGFGSALGEGELPGELHQDALIYVIQALKDQGFTLEANLLIEEEMGKHPNDQKISALYVPQSTENSKNEEFSRGKYKSDLPYKTRTIPEDALLSQASSKQNQGKYEAAISLCVQLISQYPGSTAVPKAEARMASTLDAWSKKRKINPETLTQLKKLPPDSLYEVGKVLWQKDQEDEAYQLLTYLTQQPTMGSKGGNAFYILGRIDENLGRYENARNNFKTLVTQYSGSSFFEAAHFKVGFLSYLINDSATATEWLEYSRAMTRSSYAQAKALFWLAKLFEKNNQKQKMEKYKEEIGKAAPLSFYSFLVSKMPTFVEPNSKTAPKAQSFQSAFALARAKSFLASGLHETGMNLLASINLEMEPQLMVEIGQLYNAIRQHNPAFKIAYNLAENSPSDKLSTDVSKLLFPIEFQATVQKEALANQLDPMLLFSVIKQESAYRENAESRVGALGLMQLMPATASSVAKENNFSLRGKDDLTKGEINIQLGAKYLANTIKKYSGNAIYAIAAYNAGTERVDVWVKQWSQLPIEEFIEMIPFEETRNYVKSISRNYAFYARLLENRTVSLKNLTEASSTALK